MVDQAIAQNDVVSTTATKARKVRDKPFRLMDLPLELRHMVFKEFLVMDGPIMFRSCIYLVERKTYILAPPFANVSPEGDRNVDYYKASNIVTQSNLLYIFSVSRSVYQVTVPIYFSSNTFDFKSLTAFDRFITKVGAVPRWQLARVRITYLGDAPARAFKHLARCVGLREATLQFEPYWAIGPSRTAKLLQLYGIKDLLQVRGLKKLESIVPDHFWSRARYWNLLKDAKEATSDLEERLQVLKQPIDPKKLKRLEKKNFPMNRSGFFFGAVNVLTRYAFIELPFHTFDFL